MATIIMGLGPPTTFEDDLAEYEKRLREIIARVEKRLQGEEAGSEILKGFLARCKKKIRQLEGVEDEN